MRSLFLLSVFLPVAIPGFYEQEYTSNLIDSPSNANSNSSVVVHSNGQSDQCQSQAFSFSRDDESQCTLSQLADSDESDAYICKNGTTIVGGEFYSITLFFTFQMNVMHALILIFRII